MYQGQKELAFFFFPLLNLTTWEVEYSFINETMGLYADRLAILSFGQQLLCKLVAGEMGKCSLNFGIPNSPVLHLSARTMSVCWGNWEPISWGNRAI